MRKERAWLNMLKKLNVYTWVSAILVGVLLGLFTFFVIRRTSREVTITPVGGDSVTFRGAMLDDTWYFADQLYRRGDWTYDREAHIYTLNGEGPLVLDVPIVSDAQFIFVVGPEEGVVEISTEGFRQSIDFFHEDYVEYGWKYQVEIAGNLKNVVIACVCGMLTSVLMLPLGLVFPLLISKARKCILVVKNGIASFNMSFCILVTCFSVLFGTFLFVRINFSFREVTVIPTGENDVILRGGVFDNVWYGIDQLYKSGDWVVDEDTRIYTSRGREPLTLRMPIVSDAQLVFVVGPEEGSVRITAKGFSQTYDFHYESYEEYGWGYPVTLAPSRALEYLRYMVAILAGVAVGALALVLWSLGRRISERINWRLVDRLFIVVLLPIAVWFLYYMSISSTPRVPAWLKFYGYDAAVFKTVSRAWANGLLPYRDITENKGPIMFFIYMMGAKLNETWGLFSIQCIALWISLVFSYKIGKLFAGIPKGILSSLATLFFFSFVIDEGALTEDFNLPLLMASSYYALRYIKNVKQDPVHPAYVSILYGVTFGVSLDFRVTNYVEIACYIFCISIYLFGKKKFKNLLQNMVLFILGTLIVLLPFWTYFALHGALYDMLYGTFIFNVSYAEAASGIQTAEEWRTMALYLAPTIACVFLALEKKGLMRAGVLMAALATIAVMHTCRLYPHYYIVHLTMVPICVSWFLCEPSGRGVDRSCRRYKYAYSLLAVVVLLYVAFEVNQSAEGRKYWIETLHMSTEKSEYTRVSEEMVAQIPESERNMTIAYNAPPDWYLVTDVTPCFRYCNGQDWRGAVTPEAGEEILEYFSSLQPKWIVVYGGIGNQEINSVVQENYDMVDEEYMSSVDASMMLYRRK